MLGRTILRSPALIRLGRTRLNSTSDYYLDYTRPEGTTADPNQTMAPTVKTLYEINRDLRDENVDIKIRDKQNLATSDENSNPGPGKFSKEHGFAPIDMKMPIPNPDVIDPDNTDHSHILHDHDHYHKLRIEEIHEKMNKIPTPKQLKAYLDKFIVGQDTCKKIMSVAVYNHYVRINDSLIRQLELEHQESSRTKLEVKRHLLGAPILEETDSKFEIDRSDLDSYDELPELEKSNILLLGPSGSGKTLIAKTLAKVLRVSIVIQDCTSLTQAGYVGEDIESCIEKLFAKSGNDVDLCERGIVVLDELDKLAKPSVHSGTKDISGEGVQQGLLKLIEGTNITVQGKKYANKTQVTPAKNPDDSFTVDTSNILFVGMGAFVGLDKIAARRIRSSQNSEKKEIGNNSTTTDQSESRQIEKVKIKDGRRVSALELVSSEDLVAFGLIPELIGRMPVITSLQSLTTSDLEQILTEPKNSIIQQYEYLFSKLGVRLAITKEAIKVIADQSIKNGTGARGLRSILEKVLLSANYDCPGSGISFVLINKQVVNDFVETLEGGGIGELKAKYHGRGDIFKFLEELQKEDIGLMCKIEEECGIPKSQRLEVSKGLDTGNGQEREYAI